MRTEIKNLFVCGVMLFGLSSCGTLFTSSNQYITVQGEPNAAVYDKTKLLGHTNSEGEAEVKLRKSLSSKKITIKKEGFKDTRVTVSSHLNTVSILNLMNVLAWAIDLGTGKCCKFDDDTVVFEMTKRNESK